MKKRIIINIHILGISIKCKVEKSYSHILTWEKNIKCSKYSNSSYYAKYSMLQESFKMYIGAKNKWTHTKYIQKK